jgi:transglutaminase-like putative cysteine protease
MRLRIHARLDYHLPEPADVLLQVEAAATPEQRLEEQRLTVWTDAPIAAVAGEDGVGQRCWARGHGRFVAEYEAVVRVARTPAALAGLAATPVRRLPGTLVPYLLPSRYCPSDRFEPFVRRTFPGLAGGALADALVGWVGGHLTYKAGTSAGTTTAVDTFLSQAGVCRDYAHLLVALARAGEIPARCVSAYAPGVDPPDFHAVAELWLDGAWRLVDPTGMAAADALVTVAAGRDATDIAFMTIWGEASLHAQSVVVTRLS